MYNIQEDAVVMLPVINPFSWVPAPASMLSPERNSMFHAPTTFELCTHLIVNKHNEQGKVQSKPLAVLAAGSPVSPFQMNYYSKYGQGNSEGTSFAFRSTAQ